MLFQVVTEDMKKHKLALMLRIMKRALRWRRMSWKKRTTLQMLKRQMKTRVTEKSEPNKQCINGGQLGILMDI